MNRTAKEIIAVVVSFFILFVAWYGSYLPMRKAEVYIGTLQGMQSQANPVTSVADLKNRLSVPLNAPSPIGQEELVRNMANNVLGFVQQSQDATSTAALINFVTGYFDPIIAQGRGMSFGQDVYIMGAINETAYAKTGDPAYLEAALKYYKEGETLGPNRPQSLYGLFDVYRMAGDTADAVAIGDKILANWPTDQTVKEAVAQLLTQRIASSSPQAQPASGK